MTSSGRGRRSIDELLADAAARLDRVEAVDLAAEQVAGALVVDIRPVEQRERHGDLPGALVIGRNVLEWRLDPASPDRIPEADDYDRRVILVCHEGHSSVLAAATLQDLGLHRATDLVGGYQAWASVSQSSSEQKSKPASRA
ncbi:MAG: rhodanese-like domain-containing protein [Acidimicrobiia bacterium]